MKPVMNVSKRHGSQDALMLATKVLHHHKTLYGVLHYSMANLSVSKENLYDGTLEINHRCTGRYPLSASAKGLLHMQKSIFNDDIMAHCCSVILP